MLIHTFYYSNIIISVHKLDKFTIQLHIFQQSQMRKIINRLHREGGIVFIGLINFLRSEVIRWQKLSYSHTHR